MVTELSNFLKLIRVEQFAKNLFIFLPLFFALKLEDIYSLFLAVVCFVLFCLTAGAVYIFNDIKDIDEDKNHDVKKNRPIASGQVSIPKALIIMSIFIAVAFGAAFAINITVALILVVYVFMNFLYSIKLKEIPIVDMFIVATGFVLRVIAGAVIIDVEVSRWIIITTFLLAMFLVLGKRRDDLLKCKEDCIVRKVNENYNLDFIDVSIAMIATITVMSYIMYVTSPEIIMQFNCQNLYLTAVFVILGIMRYFQLIFVHKISGSPTKILLKDRTIQFSILGWIILSFILIY